MTNTKQAQGQRPAPWKESERKIVRELREQGMTCKQIARELPGRTDRAVSKQISMMARDAAGHRRIGLTSVDADGKRISIAMLHRDDPGISSDQEYTRFCRATAHGSARLLAALQMARASA